MSPVHPSRQKGTEAPAAATQPQLRAELLPSPSLPNTIIVEDAQAITVPMDTSVCYL